MVFDISVNCAKVAEDSGCEKYIEVSTAQVYQSGKKPSNEKDKLKPWTLIAKYKQLAEEEIKKLKKLPYIIIRPSIIYGPGDLNGLLPRIICAATYTYTKDKMKLLWTGDMRIHTVHVIDVVLAIIHLWKKGKTGDIYNLSDKSDTTQNSFNSFLEAIFGIEIGYFGSVLSNLASLKLSEAVKTANDNHMAPWSEMCKKANIVTPLSPYLDKEILSNNPLSVDGSLIEETGFKYTVPIMKQEYILEEISYFENQKIFPKITITKK